MRKKENTPMRVTRRKYEERHKDERKEKNKVWGTSISRTYAEEIDEFLISYGLTKVALITAGYEALQSKYGPKKNE